MSSENGTPVDTLNPVPTLWKYNLRQRVRIKHLGGLGCVVLARADYGDHHNYLVQWWFNSEKYEVWLRESELEAVNVH